MGLIDIIDDVTYLMFWYYINYMDSIPNIYRYERYEKLYAELVNIPDAYNKETFIIVKNEIIREFSKRYNVKSELSDVVFFPNRLFYKFEYTGNMNEMKNNIKAYVQEQITTIYNVTDTILSLNVVPFEGLDITHSFIFNLIDFYIN